MVVGVALGVALASTASAQLRYEADRTCPDAAAFRRRLVARLGHDPFEHRRRAVTVRLLRAEPREKRRVRYEAILTMDGKTRRLAGDDCETAAETAVSSLAILWSASPVRSPAAPPPAAPPAPSVQRAAPTVARPPPVPVRLLLGAGALTHWGDLRDPLYGGGVEAGLQWATGLVRGQFQLSTGRTAVADSADIRYAALGLRLEACYRPSVWLLCGGLQWRQIDASGPAAWVEDQSKGTAWAVPVSLGAQIELRPHLAVEAAADAQLLLRRPHLLINGERVWESKGLAVGGHLKVLWIL